MSKHEHEVLTLGAGREVLPHNMAIRMRYMCIYACAVLLIGGRAGTFYGFTDSCMVSYQLAESRSQGSYTTK